MKRTLYLMLLMLAAVILGEVAGKATLAPFDVLGKSKSIKFMPDQFIIDTDVIQLAFGIYIKLNLGQVLFILLALFIYYKTVAKLIPGK